MNDLVNSITDKLAIIELFNQFGMAIDLRDWDSFRSLFADSVQFDYRITTSFLSGSNF